MIKLLRFVYVLTFGLPLAHEKAIVKLVPNSQLGASLQNWTIHYFKFYDHYVCSKNCGFILTNLRNICIAFCNSDESMTVYTHL